MKRNTYKRWTSEEVQYLKDNYLNTFAIDIAKKLNRPYKSVRDKVRRIGLYSGRRSRGCVLFGDKNHRWKGGISARESSIRTNNKYPERKVCRKSFECEIRYGRIKRPDICPICNQKSKYPIEAHHKDYSKPLEVEWACRERCHSTLDKRDGFGSFWRDNPK